MHKVYLLTGTNLGDRVNYLQTANNWIKIKIGNIIKSSSIYETEPWGFEAKMLFLNQALLVESKLDAHQILFEINKIETIIGRKKENGVYKSRQIDIDILFFDDIQMQLDNLKLPHPLLHQRKFVLIPMNEIASEHVHPVFNKSISQLTLECQDKSVVKKYQLKKDIINGIL
jgi:2-amino-4-hydroxy-6-hydroxymethyldihydropteridine diphosphokinase